MHPLSLSCKKLECVGKTSYNIMSDNYYLNLNGKLRSYKRALVMGIVNITPDSFFSRSRVDNTNKLLETVGEMLHQGADILDIGACSTRPGADYPDENEECKRLQWALGEIRNKYADAILSVDTFRSRIARTAVEKYNVDIINDVSGGIDKEMFPTVAALGVPYVLTHAGNHFDYGVNAESSVEEVVRFLGSRIAELEKAGVADVILDPGFGFGKTLQQNFDLLRNLELLKMFNKPLLVGVSRKSMIYKTLDCSAEKALEGTVVLNTIAVCKGASILRVHDVEAARHTVMLVDATTGSN